MRSEAMGGSHGHGQGSSWKRSWRVRRASHLYGARQLQPGVELQQLVGLLRRQQTFLLCDERVHHAVDRNRLSKVNRANQRAK
eukprot:4267784-Pleurochrysis_carterae.AAC.1